MNKQHHPHVIQIQLGATEINLLSEALRQDSPLRVTAAAVRIEAIAHRIVSLAQAIQNREQPPTEEPDYVSDHSFVLMDGELTIKRSRTLPYGKFSISEYDQENILEALEDSIKGIKDNA